MSKKPLRLIDAREGSRARLLREVQKRRGELVPTMSYPLLRNRHTS